MDSFHVSSLVAPFTTDRDEVTTSVEKTLYSEVSLFIQLFPDYSRFSTVPFLTSELQMVGTDEVGSNYAIAIPNSWFSFPFAKFY